MTSLNIEQAEDCRLCRDAKDMSCTCPVLVDDVDRQPATYRQVFPDVMNKEKTSSINQHVSQVSNTLVVVFSFMYTKLDLCQKVHTFCMSTSFCYAKLVKLFFANTYNYLVCNAYNYVSISCAEQHVTH